MQKKPSYEDLEKKIKDLEETRFFFEQLLDMLPEYISYIDKNHTYKFANKTYQECFNVSPSSMIGLHPKDVLGDEAFKKVATRHKAALSGQEQAYESTFLLPNGEPFYFRAQYLPHVNDGQVDGFLAVVKDVTVRKQAEEALRESEAKFRQLFDEMKDGLVVYEAIDGGKDFIFTDLNAAGERIANVKKSEIIGKSLYEIRPNIDEFGLVDVLRRVFQTGKAEHHAERFYEDEELQGWFDNYIYKVKSGEVVALFADNTARRVGEEALKESEERFKLAMKFANEGLYDWDLETNEIYYSPGWKRLIGYEDEEIKNEFSEWERLTKPGDVKASWTMLNEILDGKRGRFEQEFQMLHKDGHWIDILSRANVVFDENGKGIRVLGTHVDISRQKMLEEELRESENRFRKFFEALPIGAVMTDDPTKPLEVNQACADFLGYSREELQMLPGLDTAKEISHPEDFQKEKLLYDQIISGQKSQYRIQKRYIRKNGDIVIGDVHTNFLKDQNGELSLAFSIVQDITKRKEAEEALRESEKKYRRLVENALVGVYQVEKGGKFIMANERMAEIFGYDSAESLISSVDSIANLYARSEERPVVLADIEMKGAVFGKDVEFRRKDGEIIWLKLHTRVIREDAKTIYEGLMEDFTESKRAEEERIKLEKKLARSRKMEAMGLMAGGVAHDLNNILSGIVSYPELLLLDLPEDSPLRNPIKTIQESGMRAADVVEDLLTIARGVASGKDVLNLNTLVTEYLGSAEYEKLAKTRSFVNCRTDLDPDLLNMSGSSIHIKKILMNLVANASEAIEGSGTVTISTANRYLDEPLRGYEDVRIGEYVLLSVSDDGSGISQQDLERIFEPFYTKKVMGRTGTGLGLAVVWNCMQDHNGYINVRSSEKGTVFELYFPVTREGVAAEGEEVPLEDYLGQGEKILVVDDEENQREIASGMLTKLGYNAETVSSGEEAIEYVKENPVDLIVLDMVMPKGINGRKTYEEIIKIHPGQKAIIASGYAKTKEVDLAQELGAGKYIKKPYTLPKVGLAVKEELAK